MTTNTIEKNFFLTPHFSLKEMTASTTANQLHIMNCPQCHANCPTKGFVRACFGTASTTFWGDKDNEWL